MTNSQILRTPDQLLLELDRQRKYMLRVALTPVPCPMCFNALDQVQASGKTLDQFNADDHTGESFACPYCKTELSYDVPFMGPVYTWRRKHPIQTTEGQG